MTDTLLKLAERVEQAEGANCDLDHAIHDLLGDNDGAPAYTRSLDAAMQLAGADPYAVLFEAIVRCPYSETDGDAFLKALPRYVTAASLRARAREG